MNDEPARQLTIDAAVAVLQTELKHMREATSEGHRRLEQRMEGQSRVLGETRDMVREANGKAADALRLAYANSADIQALQEWRRQHDEAYAAAGGTEAAVKRIEQLAREHHDGDVRGTDRKRILAGVLGGISVGLAIAKVFIELGVGG